MHTRTPTLTYLHTHTHTYLHTHTHTRIHTARLSALGTFDDGSRCILPVLSTPVLVGVAVGGGSLVVALVIGFVLVRSKRLRATTHRVALSLPSLSFLPLSPPLLSAVCCILSSLRLDVFFFLSFLVRCIFCVSFLLSCLLPPHSFFLFAVVFLSFFLLMVKVRGGQRTKRLHDDTQGQKIESLPLFLFLPSIYLSTYQLYY